MKYKVGDLVGHINSEKGPYEITRVIWHSTLGDWVYDGKAQTGRFYYVSQERLHRWDGPTMPQSKKCDCGAMKARTTHSHWCSSVGGQP